MNYRTLADMAALIRKNVHRIPRVDLVIGIPRSGMIAASMIATLTNQQMPTVHPICDFSKHKILLVDDSIAQGQTMFRQVLPYYQARFPRAKFTTLAVYIKPDSPRPDIFLEELPGPRVFEWNWHRSKYLDKAMLDIDGVISTPTQPGEREKGQLLYRPARPVLALATGRWEEDREATTEWLNLYDVSYGRLWMSGIGRRGRETKLAACEIAKPSWIVESDQHQAAWLHARTGLPVLCTDVNRMLPFTF